MLVEPKASSAAPKKPHSCKLFYESVSEENMNHPILVQLKLTGTSTSVLAGTDLAQIPWPGFIRLYAASTVNTATLKVPNLNPSVPAVAQNLPLWANGVPQIRDMLPYTIPSSPGNPPLVELGGTTGTVYIYALLVPA